MTASFSSTPPPLAPRFLRERDVLNMVAVGRTTLRQWVATGQFPQPIELAPARIVRWELGAVSEWMLTKTQLPSDR